MTSIKHSQFQQMASVEVHSSVRQLNQYNTNTLKAFKDEMWEEKKNPKS